MNKEKISFKEEARRAFSKGDWGKALDHFQKHCSREPGDLRSRLKMADVLERLGRKDEAIQEYRKVAEGYATEGFIVQAISVNKIILRINPSLKDVNDRLVQLYTEKVREAKPISPFPRIPLFSELQDQELQSMVPQVSVRTFQKGETICQDGDPGDSLMVISRGEVGIFKQAPKGKEAMIRSLKEGDFFGEFGYFTDHKRHATVRALTEPEVLEISREGLHEVIRAHPRIHDVLYDLYKQRVLDLFLSVSPLFAPLSSFERDEVFKRFRSISVPQDTLLFNGGDLPRSLYLIRSGEVEIFIRNPRGENRTLSLLKAGDFFGEIGPLFNKPRTASARTMQPSELLELTKEDLGTCLSQFPQIRETLKEITVKRLTRLNLEIFSHKRSEQVREAMV